MGLLDPLPPPYDPLEWEKKPFAERAKLSCQAWALQGYGTPLPVVFAYVLKVGAYIGGWLFFCGFSPELGGLATIGDWWLHPIAFQKAIVWSMLFEVMGFGCGSGPLTARYMPPLGGCLYFLRPGTTKLPWFEGVPLIGGHRRTILDVMLYAGLLGVCVWTLISPELSHEQILILVILVPLLGLLDKTLFLIARGEHYWTTLVVFAVATDWIAGAKSVQLALWFWAGFSKLNHHFPTVVCVMMSNSPIMRIEAVRKAMYRDYPEDLRPSKLARVLAHFGTALEFSVPLVLIWAPEGAPLIVGMVLMLMLHSYITGNLPMGVPIEWNVMVVYGAFALFWTHPEVTVLDLGLTPLTGFLVTMLVLVPLMGNLFPRWVSFLLSMRYYAGNWPMSVWLFKGESYRKLDDLVASSPWVEDQLAHFYDRKTALGLLSKVVAFRMMHLHGRALPVLIPKAVDEVEDYTYVEGEVVSGLVVGWNFGDGHLHNEQLLRAVQAQLNFEPGELRCVFVESQPFARPIHNYRLFDAATGLIEEGELSIPEMRSRQPWEAAASATGS